MTKELCHSCKLLPIDAHTVPVCRVCFFEIPADIDRLAEPEEIRFQTYLLEGMRLSSISLTRQLMAEGLCPYLNRTEASRLRGRKLQQEAIDCNERFKQECNDD
jgi:hypothetical protein